MNDRKAGIGMHGHSVQVIAGFISSTIFISGNFPMLFKALKTKDMHSYSMGQLILGNMGNTVYWLYVASLPVGPIWLLQGFFSLSSATMLLCYLRYEKKCFDFRVVGALAVRAASRVVDILLAAAPKAIDPGIVPAIEQRDRHVRLVSTGRQDLLRQNVSNMKKAP